MGAIIWQKVTTCNTTGGATIMGSFPYPRNGIIKIDYEFILIFKKYGEAPPVSAAVKEQSRLTTEEWNLYFNGHWNFPGEKQDKHLAMFPEELPRRLIRMFSFKGDTVLDPFLGSGTTSLAARNLGRNSVGYEINPAFLPIIEDKLGINQSKIFETTGYEIIHQKDKTIDFNERISSLPYAFKDPIKFDKKVDPKKMSFGSRIDDHPRNREELFAVEKIVSPEIMILDNGLKIRLLGIKAINDRIEQAIDYLREKTKGQKIFLRFDSIKHDKENNLLCYVYLKNRLFLNAHLIKEGLAEVETSYDFKYKVKFEKEKRELNA